MCCHFSGCQLRCRGNSFETKHWLSLVEVAESRQYIYGVVRQHAKRLQCLMYVGWSHKFSLLSLKPTQGLSQTANPKVSDATFDVADVCCSSHRRRKFSAKVMRLCQKLLRTDIDALFQVTWVQWHYAVLKSDEGAIAVDQLACLFMLSNPCTGTALSSWCTRDHDHVMQRGLKADKRPCFPTEDQRDPVVLWCVQRHQPQAWTRRLRPRTSELQPRLVLSKVCWAASKCVLSCYIMLSRNTQAYQ